MNKPATHKDNDIHAEEALAAALMADPYAIMAVRDICHWRDWLNERPRQIARAAWLCMEASIPISRTTITSMLRKIGIDDQAVSDAYLIDLDDRAVTAVVAAAKHNAARVAELAVGRRLAARARQFADLVSIAPETSAELVSELLAGLHTDQQAAPGGDRDALIGAIDDDDDLNTAAAAKTGLVWLDGLTGGFRPGEIWAIAARYKGRKTTLALNLILRAARQGTPCSYLITEGTRVQLRRRLVAMLATARMRADQVAEAEWTIGGLGLATNMRTAAQHQAIEWAREAVKGLPLRIYDGQDGIQTLERLSSIGRRDAACHGARLIVIDYIQQIEPQKAKSGNWQDSAFERSVREIQNMTTSEGLTTIVLGQRTEARNGGERGENAGMKGGGALAAASDFYLESTYNEDESPNVITLDLRYSRYSAVGRNPYLINPASGLILNPGVKSQ